MRQKKRIHYKRHRNSTGGERRKEEEGKGRKIEIEGKIEGVSNVRRGEKYQNNYSEELS
jgi:hypothetical protein